MHHFKKDLEYPDSSHGLLRSLHLVTSLVGCIAGSDLNVINASYSSPWPPPASSHPPSLLDQSHVRVLDVHCVWSPQSPHPGHCFISRGLRVTDSGSFSKEPPHPHSSALARVLKSPSHLGARLDSVAQSSVSACHPRSILVGGRGGWERGRGRLSWQNRLMWKPVVPTLFPGTTHIHHCTQARDTLLLPLPLFKVLGPSSWFPNPRHTPIPQTSQWVPGSPSPHSPQGQAQAPKALGSRCPQCDLVPGKGGEWHGLNNSWERSSWSLGGQAWPWGSSSHCPLAKVADLSAWWGRQTQMRASCGGEPC